MNTKELKALWKQTWHFIWEDDSLLSWVVNVIIAFILVKFIIYPGLGFLLGTSFPVVAVVSGSMEHNGLSFDTWWEQNAEFYITRGIGKEGFKEFSFHNGFNKGDIIILVGATPQKINKGTVLVYSTHRYKYPIIHRVTKKTESEGGYTFETKGDNNPTTDPEPVSDKQILGRAMFRIPFLGWIKILFTEITGIGG